MGRGTYVKGLLHDLLRLQRAIRMRPEVLLEALLAEGEFGANAAALGRHTVERVCAASAYKARAFQIIRFVICSIKQTGTGLDASLDSRAPHTAQLTGHSEVRAVQICKPTWTTVWDVRGYTPLFTLSHTPRVPYLNHRHTAHLHVTAFL